MSKKETKSNNEPTWLNPKNDRKTPYTEEELELFVDGFINEIDDMQDWKRMVQEVGEQKAREILKEGFKRMDPNGPFKVKDFLA